MGNLLSLPSKWRAVFVEKSRMVESMRKESTDKKRFLGQFVPLVWHAKAVLCFHRIQVWRLILATFFRFLITLTWSVFEIFFISTTTFAFIFRIRKFIVTINASVTIFFADSIKTYRKWPKSDKIPLPDIWVAFRCSLWYIFYSDTIGCSVMHLDTWCMGKRS